MTLIFPVFLSANKFSTYTFFDQLSFLIKLPIRKPNYLSAIRRADFFLSVMRNINPTQQELAQKSLKNEIKKSGMGIKNLTGGRSPTQSFLNKSCWPNGGIIKGSTCGPARSWWPHDLGATGRIDAQTGWGTPPVPFPRYLKPTKDVNYFPKFLWEEKKLFDISNQS